MPDHRKVLSLESLSLQAVGTLVVTLAPPILECLNPVFPHEEAARLQATLTRVRNHLVSHVPYYLYDSMAVEVLGSVKLLIERKKKTYDPLATISSFLTEMNVVVSLTEVVLNQHLKYLDFTAWPKIMRYVMYKNLDKLVGLEVLNLGACAGGWRTDNFDKYLIEGISRMKYLRSLCLCFDCADCIVAVIGDCRDLQILDVTSSRSVTDRSIPSLLKCRKLCHLQLHRTSISVLGYAQLMIGLPNLQDLGRCDEFGEVVMYLAEKHPEVGPFPLMKLQARDLNSGKLRAMVQMFPKLSQLSFLNNESVTDMRLLCHLDHLKDLKLLSCDFYTDFLNQIIEVRGFNLVSLHLEHVEKINMDALVHISQHCPLLKNLVLYNCDFIDQTLSLNKRLKVPPFQCLERVFWVVDCAIAHLEFVLSHATNIKYIHLGSSTGITHGSIVRILAVNPMKNLEEMRILYSSDMNMETVELLLASCAKLRILSELESWQGISLEELMDFKKCIYANNFDLDIRPTLSY